MSDMNRPGRRTERSCDVCGSLYTVLLHRLNAGRGHTCSMKCSYVFRAAKLLRPNNPRTTLACAVCGRQYKNNHGVRSKSGLAFCSISCRSEGKRRGLIQHRAPVISDKLRAQLRVRARQMLKGQKPATFITFSCKGCRAPTTLPLSRMQKGHTRKYCSRKCWAHAQTGPGNPRWRDGSSTRRFYLGDWWHQRQAALTRDGRKCRKCGAVGRLHVHHITPVRMFKNPRLAHFQENLITLCPTCHARVERGLDSLPQQLRKRWGEMEDVEVVAEAVAV